jgi:hypothetical protein
VQVSCHFLFCSPEMTQLSVIWTSRAHQYIGDFGMH